ncbi:MAG: hypothetical protein ACR2KK_01295 [Acidimicrobiales bacterium]
MKNATESGYWFITLTPIIAGREAGLLSFLRALPTHAGSPLAKLPQTHFARWVVIPELVYEGPPQRPDPLKSQYLLFTSCFDGHDPKQYLDDLCDLMGDEADRIWGSCAGYRGRHDLKRYLLHNQIDTALVFAAYGDATVQEVLAALELRKQLREFVLAHETSDEISLLDEWQSAAWPGAPAQSRGPSR